MGVQYNDRETHGGRTGHSGRTAGAGTTAPEAGTEPEPGAGAADGERDAFFDNAKYLAIILVACAHAWEPYRGDSRAATALYIVVYAFHMPAFILISGYFSRGFDLSPRKVRRLLTCVVVPYVLFETAYSLFRRWAHDEPGYPVSLVDPYFLSWFLIALFLWRLTTPLWQNVKWPVAIALGVSLAASLTPDIGPDLDLQRVLQFLPFFVLGLALRAEHFDALRGRRVRLLAAAVFAGASAFTYWAVPRMGWEWFYHRRSAQEMGVPGWTGGTMTLALFGCSLVLIACFLAWVPRRPRWFTTLGAGTLYGYLLHGFLARGSVFWGWYDAAWVRTPAGMVLVTALAAAVVTFLCGAPVRRAFRWAVEPSIEWLFHTAPVGTGHRPPGTEVAAGTTSKVAAPGPVRPTRPP